MPKEIDQNVLTLGMWVIGAQEDGTPPTDRDARMKFNDNWRKLRTLLFTPDRQFVLTKRFYVNGVLKTASAKAEYSSGLVPQMNGEARAVFTVDITVADGLFYGPDVITSLSTGTQTVTVGGDVKTRNIRLHAVGARTNLKVRNNTLGVDVECHAVLASGDTWDADVKAYTSVTDPAATAAYDSTGSIRHTGDAAWLLLQPGTNSIVVSSDSGIGAVTMTHNEAWL